MRDAEAVFVGTVVAKSEPASIGDALAAAAGQHVNVQPIHFEVERTLHGDARPSLQLLYPEGPGWGGEVSEVFDVGDRLLVFAETRTFGSNQITGLTASGYHQGVFAFESEDVVRNESTGIRMSLPGLEAELARRS